MSGERTRSAKYRGVLVKLTIPCVILLLSLTVAVSVSADAKVLNLIDTTSLLMKGWELSEEEAQQLEEEVKADPENLSARIQLLGYYSTKRFDSDAAREARVKHILWIIERYPDSEIAGSPAAELNPLLDGKSYYKAKELWLKQVEKHKKNTKVIGNATRFFLLSDRDVAEDLLEQAQALEPDNPDWPKRLGFLYMLEGRHGWSLNARKEMMAKALEQYEKAADLTTDPMSRFYVLSDIAEAAYGAGETEKATAYATQLLDLAGQHKNDWNYGNAIHDGNMILGRVALTAGNVGEANAHLLKAGATPGSPQLNSFGPDFTLAEELLEKGEKETVIEYLKLCKKFWKEAVLDKWIKMIEADIEPDFDTPWMSED